ncbi:MAG: hypothetical protein M0R21_02350 [Lentimicrobiaceae bacterium]|nr:hypothetical protein [Lentimicrobiaceae bacterium]
MECKEVQSKMVFYSEESFSVSEKRLITEHLLTCQQCNLLFNQLQSVFQEMKEDLQNANINPYFTAKVIEKIKNQNTIRSAPMSFFLNKLTPLTVAVIAGIIVGIIIGNTLWYGSVPFTVFSDRDTVLAISASEYYLDDDGVLQESLNTYLDVNNK